MPDPIEHVVALQLENHSFDQMLGALTAVYPDLDGVQFGAEHSNLGQVVNQPKARSQFAYEQRMTDERQMLLDPKHEVANVAVQMKHGNSGFVENFQKSYPNWSVPQCYQIMSYYMLDCLPALHTLARNFTVCDRWFSSLPGPTWPNRFFALTGTSNGRANMPDTMNPQEIPQFFLQTQPTVFDRLNEKGISWNVFFHDFPVSMVLDRQRRPENRARYRTMDQFDTAVAGPESAFPKFSFIEPMYSGYDQNDDHPPHDVLKAQNLIARIYNSIRANEALWKKTLLVVYYDEHGGFYDHVVPPAAVAPDDNYYEYTFAQYGIRVPAILVSPWLDARVEHTEFDHTSLLKYLQDKWGLGALGRRTANANSFESCFRTSARDDCPDHIEMSPADPQMDKQAVTMDSAHHSALATLVRFLDNTGTIAYVDAASYLEAAKARFMTLFQ